ncbi:hypothetical protein [Rhodanobacter sp. L36]|uniref:hypothetical protein n=1 Tax=Rhodanobacter sp. L36 TaxID=1747221 RepID=UPI001C2044BD|nr:hypothetical protein [Rhodanobacter sp. L36]
MTDSTRGYLPAKYYERIALDAMRRKDYEGAVSAYESAGYWANKVAQFDLGEIYFHGMGSIPADRARGVAWLGIAAEEHNPDYDKALVNAYADLTPEERRRADGIWKELQAVYGDKLTLARATQIFERDHRAERLGSATTENDTTVHTFSTSGYNPAKTTLDNAAMISELNTTSMRTQASTVADIWSARKQEFDATISSHFAHVDVGPIEQVPSAEKKPVP